MTKFASDCLQIVRFVPSLLLLKRHHDACNDTLRSSFNERILLERSG